MTQEQVTELEFWEWREFWRHGDQYANADALVQGENVPVRGEQKWFDDHLCRVTDVQKDVVVIGTPNSPPVTLVFCEYGGSVMQSIS